MARDELLKTRLDVGVCMDDSVTREGENMQSEADCRLYLTLRVSLRLISLFSSSSSCSFRATGNEQQQQKCKIYATWFLQVHL